VSRTTKRRHSERPGHSARQPQARPTRVVEKNVRDRLIAAFDAGYSVETACDAAGISRSTFYNWANRAATELDRLSALATAENPNPTPRPDAWPYVDLLDRVSRARARRLGEMLAIVDKVARGGSLLSHTRNHTAEGGFIETRTYAGPDWRAATWWIERAFPGQFGRQVQQHHLEVTGKGGGPIEVTDRTALNAIADRLAESFAWQREHGVGEQPPALAIEEAPVDAEIVDGDSGQA
jgi:hypothetical protein